jgi:hypothetical protein
MKVFHSLAATAICMILGQNALANKFPLAGDYQCTGVDSHDGAYTHPLTLIPDVKASEPDRNFEAYTFTSGPDKGYAAAQGDAYGFYFLGIDEKNPEGSKNFGVGIVTVSYDPDVNGKAQITLHSSYYQPEYHRDKNGGKGFGSCIKVK